MKSSLQVWFPLGVLVFLLNWCCTGPLALPCGVTHLLSKHLDRIPLCRAFPGYPLAAKTKVTDGFASSCGSFGGRGTEGCWRLRAGLPVLRVECHYQHTEASLILEPPPLSLPPAVWWDFSRGQKCARSTAINPAYCAFLWRAVHWQPLPLFIIEQTAFLPVSMDIVSCLSKSLHADFATVDAVF